MDIGFSIMDNELLNINKTKIKKLSKMFSVIQIMFSTTNFDTNKFKILLKQIKPIIKTFNTLFIHASYQINIGSELILSNNNLFNIGISILIDEIKISKKLKANGIVLHIGKNTKGLNNQNNVYNNMVMFVIELFEQLKKQSLLIDILFETPAGQNGDMLYDLNNFVSFIESFKSQSFYNNICVCIDTCHIFQAGYDINNKKVLDNVFNIFEPIKNKVKLIHLNDSKNIVGKHLDRHEKIGFGKINVSSLRKIIQHFEVPFVLETVGPYEQQILNLYEN